MKMDFSDSNNFYTKCKILWMLFLKKFIDPLDCRKDGAAEYI